MGNFNPNYFDRKAGSLERAVLDAINGVKSQIQETNKNDKSDDGEGMDKVQPKAVKKKFDDRKDKDIDNDGDVDSSDKYLHKRRKAIGKAMKSEATGKDIAKKMMGSKTMKGFASKVAKMKSVTKGDLENMLPDYVNGADISKLFEAQDGGDFKTHMMYDPKTGKGYEAKTMEDHLRMKKMGYDHKKPNSESFESQGEADWNETVSIIQKKQTSMREALAKVWGFDEGHNPFKKEEKVPKGFHRMPDGSLMKDSDMDKKENKTMTGKSATKVTVDPDMKKD